MTSSRAASARDAVLRRLLSGMHRVLTFGWFLRRPRTFGAHAVALTPEGKVILVRLRYATGWRVPGGGRKAREDPEQAVLRELREEIGMTAHGAVQLACELEESTDFKRDLAALFIVRDVRYRPHRWSWEVEQVMEVPVTALPEDMSPLAKRWIATVRPNL
ncbi:8-oxo-dGTP pyrophosphatase MutT (NUDIX family) [Sphingomonas sp. F9_3S_D5_B_2]